MRVKRIMVCLDGSKNSLHGLDTAISFAKQVKATIVCVHIDTGFSLFTAVHGPKISEHKWSNEEGALLRLQRKEYLAKLNSRDLSLQAGQLVMI